MSDCTGSEIERKTYRICSVPSCLSLPLRQTACDSRNSNKCSRDNATDLKETRRISVRTWELIMQYGTTLIHWKNSLNKNFKPDFDLVKKRHISFETCRSRLNFFLSRWNNFVPPTLQLANTLLLIFNILSLNEVKRQSYKIARFLNVIGSIDDTHIPISS